MPTIGTETGTGAAKVGNKEISFTSADTGATATSVKTVRKESSAFFAGINWTHAGVYVYEVTETANTYTIADAVKEKMDYSLAKYTITVYVKEKTSGTGFYVDVIADVITFVDNPGQTGGSKVDPTPGGNTETATGFSDMIFTNKYLKNNGGTDPDPDDDSTFKLSKTVSGSYASKEQYFTFTVKITPAVSPLVPAGVKYKAYTR